MHDISTSKGIRLVEHQDSQSAIKFTGFLGCKSYFPYKSVKGIILLIPNGIKEKVLDRDFKIKEFKFQLYDYVHFQSYPLGKGIVDDCGRRRPEGSLFNSYYTKV